MSRVFFYPHLKKALNRVPEHYKTRYLEARRRKPISVHMHEEPGNWKKVAGSNAVYPISYFNIPPRVLYPKQSQRCLWGGEGIVVGFRQRSDVPPMHPRTWRPAVQEQLFYSEILDRWMVIVVTPRALDLIEQAKGFDNYILSTHEVDLKSRLGMFLKRDMLLALVRKSMFPNDPVKREAVYEKYKQFILPEEEVEWLGFTLEEAAKKQLKLEHEESDVGPLKRVFLEELGDELEGNSEKKSEEESAQS